MYANALSKNWTLQGLALLGTLAVALALPFIVHIIGPVGGVPLGARLLPIFIAPLLAVVLFNAPVAVAASLLAPVLNHLIIGSPTQPITILVTVELTVFAVVVSLLHMRWPNFWAAAPVGYLLGMVAAMIVLFITPIIPAPPFTWFTNSIVTAIPGIVILLAINFAVLRYLKSRHAD
jgi:hypothetical protein